MAELIKSINKTVFPDGKVRVYEYGMLPKALPIDENKFKVWRRWLRMLKLKYTKIDNQTKS